jgi:prepilin-type N-terminal cleavage/methylation domain-containing protein
MKTKEFSISDFRFASGSQREALIIPRLDRAGSSVVHPYQLPAESIPIQRFNDSTIQRRPRTAFTLIELLVVIAIAVIIAGLLITAGAAVVRKSNLNRATSELQQITTAIDAYKAKYGYYPPGNALVNGGGLTNQLFYELLGTQPAISSGASQSGFATMDAGNFISTNTMISAFGVSSFMNCTKGSGEDSAPGQTFLAGLKAGEIASNSPSATSGSYTFIVTAANSDSAYTPMPGVYSLAGRPANPWRYVCPGTNSPTGYDLWVQIFSGNKTNLICNWAKQPLVNVPMP